MITIVVLVLAGMVALVVIAAAVLVMCQVGQPAQPLRLYIARDGRRAGPFTVLKLGKLVDDGEVSLQDLAWHEGLTEWQPLEQLLSNRAEPVLQILKNRLTPPQTRR